MGSRQTNITARPGFRPGFAQSARIWSAQDKCHLVKILPGEYYVTKRRDGITTVLGSCVSACVRDPASGIGGMNHFMLPEAVGPASPADQEIQGLPTRFGLEAMETLICDLVRYGADGENLEFKLFGGAHVLDMPQSNVGKRNIHFVRQFISERNYALLAEDLGGVQPRKIVYRPDTGRVMVRKMRALHNNSVARQEQSYCKKLDRGNGLG